MLNDELRDSAYKADVTAGAVRPITRLVNDSGYVLCAAIGCLWAIAGRITVGNVQAMLEYTRRFAEPFSSIAEMAGSFGAATAAQSACAHNFIKALLGSYDMVLSKGAENISQGERQLLTIARAIASDPEIMILDEVTSNVDTHTEVLIQKAMAELMKGRTSFVIAHRLSTILDADMILYMEDGDIKEVGTHNELMALGGKYNALYNSQFA